MRYHRLIRRLYRCTAQIVILLLVTSGYGPPSVYARANDHPGAVNDQMFSLDELVVTDSYAKEDLFVHGLEQAPQIDVMQRPISPQEAVHQVQNILSISAGSVITVISTRGVHNDPTLSADGRRVAFWSTSNLAPKRPIANTMFINEVYAYESIYAVEIYNGGLQPVDMTGWRLTEWYGVNTQHVVYTFPPFTLEAGAYIRLYNFSPADEYPPYYFYTGVDYIYGDGVNDGGAVRLQNDVNAEIDFVRWGNSNVDPLLPNNWLSPFVSNPPPPRANYCHQYCFYFWGGYWCFCMPETLGRNVASFDSNTWADWCRQRYTLGYQNSSTCGLSQDNPDGNIEIYVADVETPELGVTEDVTFTQVSRSMGSILGGFNLQPSVSGDGTRVAFFSDRDLIGTNGDENFEIFLYDVASKQIYSVTNSLKGANILPSINGDGTRIAFVSDRDGNQEIFVAEVDGSWNIDITQVTETSGDVINDQPSISADGNWIAFVSNWNHQGSTQEDNLEIFVVNVGAGKPYSFVRVTNTSSDVDNEQPSIDGDGSRVAFARLQGSTSSVYWADAGFGWNNNLIPATGTVNENPAINSYGDRIVFVSGQSVMLHYIEFDQSTTLATVLDTSIQPSRPDIATTASYLDTWVVFAAGGSLYHIFSPLQDISIGKAFEPQHVGPGDAVTYTIHFANYGMYPAPNAYITDSLPAELQSVQCLDGGYTLIETTTECRWNLGAVYSGAEGVVTVTAVISTGLAAGYQITNTATITSDPNEPNVANNVAPVVITIINLPPTARDDAYSVVEDGSLSIAAPGVLTNDTDPNADTLTVTLITPVTNGDLSLDEDGGFAYMPDPHYHGTDAFVYRADDGHGGTATATVTINITAVNDAPVNWLPDPQTITEDHTLTLSLSSGNAITVSDVDAGSNAIQVTLTVPDGTLTLGGIAGLSFSNGDGVDDATMTFTGTIAAINTALDGLAFSPTLNFSGTTGLQIVSNDQGYSGSPGPQTATDTLSITVIGINDAPVLDLDDTTAGKDAQHAYEAAAPNKWIAPNASVSDVDTQVAYATATLLTHPDGVSETLACGDCGLYGITSSYDGATYTLLMTVTRGAFNYQEALKSVTYDNSSAPPQLGDREIRVVIYDTGGLTDTAVSTVTLLNSRPIAIDDLALTQEETPVDIDVLANDDDIDNDPMTIIVVGPPSHGTAFTVTVGITVMIRYTAETDFVGTDVFTYTIRDLPGGTDTATVTVSVSSDNDPPVNTVPSGPYPLYANEDQSLSFSEVDNTFSITDVDAYTNAVQVSLVATNGILFLGNPGSVSITAGADGTSQVVFGGTITDANTALNGMTFSPTLNYNGPATITIRTDDLGYSGSGGNRYDVDTVPISVIPQPDAPRFTSTPVPTATSNVVYIYNITTTDPDGPGLIAITAPVLPSWLVLVDNGDGTATLSGTPGPPDRGIHDVTLEATDATPLVDTQVFTIEVLAPELSVAKYASHPDPLMPDSTISYIIVISNVGNLAATNVTVVDTLPSGTSYVGGSSQVRSYQAGTYLDQFGTTSYTNSDNPSADWSTTPWTETNDDGSPSTGWILVSGGMLQFHDDTSSGNGSATYWVEREVNLTAATAATLTFGYDEEGVLEPEDQVTVSVFDGSIWHDVLTQSDDFGGWLTFGPQDISTYANASSRVRFQVTGYGGTSGPAEDFRVDDVAVQFVRSRGPEAGGNPQNLVTSGDNWTLYPGQTMTVTFAAQVDPGLADGTMLVNTVDVACDQAPTPVQATVSSTISVPDLTLTKTYAGTGSVGERITYTIVIANDGSADATGAVISDTTPISTTFVPGSITLDPSGAGNIGGENTLVTNLTIAAGQQVTVTFVVTADSSGTIRNTASVTCTEVITPETDSVDSTVAATSFDSMFWVRDKGIDNGSVAVAMVGLPALIALVAPRRNSDRKKQRQK
jgi:uncharacterized repeat protein (TIGR01451 family)